MGAFRIKFGTAYGPYGTASGTSSQFLLTPQDTTPDVTNGTFFVTNNTSAVTITHFDVQVAGGLPGTAENGKQIFILAQDNNTTIQNGGRIFLQDTQAALAQNSVIGLIYHNSAWYETYRSENDQTPQDVANRSVSYSFSGTAGNFNVTTARYLLLTASATASVITGFVGGTSGQELLVKVVGLGSSVFFAQSAGVLALAGTTTVLMSNTAFYKFFTVNGVEWFSQSGLLSP